jgi:hypothetical protein
MVRVPKQQMHPNAMLAGHPMQPPQLHPGQMPPQFQPGMQGPPPLHPMQQPPPQQVQPLQLLQPQQQQPQAQQPHAAGQAPPGGAPAASKPVWTEHVDKTSGKTYYYNAATKQSSWTKVILRFAHSSFLVTCCWRSFAHIE